MSTKLTDVASIEQILKEMPLEEKARLVIGSSGFRSAGSEEFGIPKAVLLDGGTGYNSMQMGLENDCLEIFDKLEAKGTPIDPEKLDGMAGLAVPFSHGYLLDPKEEDPNKDMRFGCYPPGMFFGATWNPDPIKACGNSLGKEMNWRGVDVVLGTPNVNIHRDPLNGRLFEGYSEDPCLVSKLAPAFVKGVQEEGVIANVKHFAANSQEKDRMGVNEIISERALREIYLPGFKACVDAGCMSVMSAYNKINGEPCAMKPWLLTKVLREDWGFDGFVVSDWSASYDQVVSLAAGNDLIMPGPRGTKCIIDAVNEGRLSMEKLDECLRNWLKILLLAPVMNERVQEYDIQQAIDACDFVAKEGITLLQNDGTLPLAKAGAKVAFYGKRSVAFAGSGAGSAEVATSLLTNPCDSAKDMLGAENVTFGEAAADTNIWVVTVGANGQEGSDRPHMEMDADDKEALEQAIAEAAKVDGKVIILMNTCGPIDLMPYKDRVNAIICAYYPGMMGGKVAMQIMFGEVNPSGKLPLSWPKAYRDCPSYRNFGGEAQEVVYGEGIYVGYRYYDMKGIEPLYPFGFGLSYTTFEIGDLKVPAEVDIEKEDIPVTVTVKNTGAMDGSEVVQVYIHDVISRQEKPDKELKAFKKVFVKAGESVEVTLTLNKQDLASFSEEMKDWATEPGEYEILVGNSSRNITACASVNVLGKNPFIMSDETSVGEVLSKGAAVDMINALIGADIKDLCKICIVFFPQVKFGKAYPQYVGDFLLDKGLTQAEVDAIHAQILENFKNM